MGGDQEVGGAGGAQGDAGSGQVEVELAVSADVAGVLVALLVPRVEAQVEEEVGHVRERVEAGEFAGAARVDVVFAASDALVEALDRVPRLIDVHVRASSRGV